MLELKVDQPSLLLMSIPSDKRLWTFWAMGPYSAISAVITGHPSNPAFTIRPSRPALTRPKSLKNCIEADAVDNFRIHNHPRPRVRSWLRVAKSQKQSFKSLFLCCVLHLALCQDPWFDQERRGNCWTITFHIRIYLAEHGWGTQAIGAITIVC